MDKAETPHVTLLFERGSPLDARVWAAIYLFAQVRDATRILARRRGAIDRRRGRYWERDLEALFPAGHQGCCAAMWRVRGAPGAAASTRWAPVWCSGATWKGDTTLSSRVTGIV